MNGTVAKKEAMCADGDNGTLAMSGTAAFMEVVNGRKVEKPES